MNQHFDVTLPANTQIGATAFANAAFTQEITVSVDGAVVARFSGSGPRNKLLGSSVFNSGSGRARVQITANGKPSVVTGAQIILTNKLNFVTIGSEDGRDGDFNDGLLVMNWPIG